MKSSSLIKYIAISLSLFAGATGFAYASSHSRVLEEAVVSHYADIALAKYEDSLITAQSLDAAIKTFLENPNDRTLNMAKTAWFAARVPYQQSEVYRFGNAIVDDWEGRVNAWPLDEGFIDYVDKSYGEQSGENNFYTANVIANAKISINGQMVDAKRITPEFLSTTLQEAGGIEANVATGYHAIEFLLWGQDLNGTKAGNGVRPATDYNLENCTNNNCDRRREYLLSVSKLLVSDLEEMVGNWVNGGAARRALIGMDAHAGISTILTGMGSLSYGELAGERMKLGLLLHDPEEEHDCFSDNTHNSHLYNAIGIQNVYLGRYKRIDGTVLKGASLAEFAKHKDEVIAGELTAKLTATINAMEIMAARADQEAYDQMIGEGNIEGNAIVQAAIDSLINQTQSIERVIAVLKLDEIELEGSDSLDKPHSIFQ